MAAGGVGEVVAGVEVEDAVGLDGVEREGLALVAEDGDLLFELERFLLDVEDESALRVADAELAREREQLEGELQRVVHGCLGPLGLCVLLELVVGRPGG